MDNQIPILIIDDEIELAEVMGLEFEELGFKVFTTNQASEAINLCKQEAIGWVISDIRMPKMDGVELMQEILKVQPQTSVLLMSGYSEYDEPTVKQRGAHSLHLKPVDCDQIADVIRSSKKQTA